MTILNETRQKLLDFILILNKTNEYTELKNVMMSLENGLAFTKEHYRELNECTLVNNNNFRGADIYFFFMRYIHQFFNIVNLSQNSLSGSYYQKFMHIYEYRQTKFIELSQEAIHQANILLEHTDGK